MFYSCRICCGFNNALNTLPSFHFKLNSKLARPLLFPRFLGSELYREKDPYQIILRENGNCEISEFNFDSNPSHRPTSCHIPECHLLRGDVVGRSPGVTILIEIKIRNSPEFGGWRPKKRETRKTTKIPVLFGVDPV